MCTHIRACPGVNESYLTLLAIFFTVVIRQLGKWPVTNCCLNDSSPTQRGQQSPGTLRDSLWIEAKMAEKEADLAKCVPPLGPFPRIIWIHQDTPLDRLDEVCYDIWKRTQRLPDGLKPKHTSTLLEEPKDVHAELRWVYCENLWKTLWSTWTIQCGC